MQQLEVKKVLKIHLSNKQIAKFSTSKARLKKGYYCFEFGTYLKKANRCLIDQLCDLINENYIDLQLLKDLGLYETVRMDCLQYKISNTILETRIINNYKIKEKVINNILCAINTIDYSLNNNTLKQ